MEIMKKVIRTTLASCVMLAANTTFAQPEALKVCSGCHGMDGVAVNNDYANLGGQNAAYLELQLRAFRSGERKNVFMNPTAANLTDEDIAEVAAWYSAQPHITASNGDPALVEEGRNRAGYCHSCHGMKGYPVAEEWPILAGQNAAYIAIQLRGFVEGMRQHPLMEKPASMLDEGARQALGAYYSQVPDAD